MFGFFKKNKAPEIPMGPKGPDFSVVDTLGKAKALVKEGVLEPMYLFPPAFGGPTTPVNTIYVPVGLSYVKESFDENQVMTLVEAGEEVNYVAEPEYQGHSVVPIALKITAGRINADIRFWGEALDRNITEDDPS